MIQKWSGAKKRSAKRAAAAFAAFAALMAGGLFYTMSASADTFCDGDGNRIVKAGEYVNIGSFWESCGSQGGVTTKFGANTGGYVIYWRGDNYYDLGSQLCEKLIMQGDGNLVCYDEGRGGSVVYSSGTDHNDGAYLAVQTDGNVVIYQSNGSFLKKLNR